MHKNGASHSVLQELFPSLEQLGIPSGWGIFSLVPYGSAGVRGIHKS